MTFDELNLLCFLGGAIVAIILVLLFVPKQPPPPKNYLPMIERHSLSIGLRMGYWGVIKNNKIIATGHTVATALAAAELVL